MRSAFPVVLAVVALLLTIPNAVQGQVDTATNGIYDVHVQASGAGQQGSWNAVTGASNPTGPGNNLMYDQTTVITNFSSLRDYTTGITYTFGGRGGGTNLDPFFTSQGASPFPNGIRTSWTIPSELSITQDVFIPGTTFANSAIYHTVTISNLGSTATSIGWRNLYDWAVNDPGFDDGPNNQIENSAGSVLVPATTLEFAYFPTGADLARVSIDPGVPTYQPLLGLGYDPGLYPLPTTPPEEYDYVSWPISFGTAFDYTPTGANVTGDSAGLSWWGRDLANEVDIAPGASVTFTEVVFGVPPGAPPPNGAVPEPSTLIIWSLLGGLGVAFGWWRRRSA